MFGRKNRYQSPDAGKSPNQVQFPEGEAAELLTQLAVGTKVRITKEAARPNGGIAVSVEGTVKSHEMRKTGSWHAHGKDDKLWLDRLTIVKADGELYMCNLDPQTRVEVLQG